jgi:hypothetical protein
MRALAPAGEVLFFAPPKKSTQKKGGPKACPVPNLRFGTGSPALLAKTGAHATHKFAALNCSNKRELHPVFTAMLGCAYGRVIQNLRPLECRLLIYPSRSTHRVPEPIRGIGAHLYIQAGECFGRLFFSSVFFGGAKKTDSLRGRESPHQIQSRLTPLIFTQPVLIMHD